MTVRHLLRRKGLEVLGAVLLASGSAPAPAGAQVFEARIGRFYDSPGWTAYRVGFTRPLGGAFGTQIHGDYLQRVGDRGGFAGVGADLTVFRTGQQGPYLVAGLSGGLGSANSYDFSTFWGSWSAGAGYDLFPVSFLSVGAEGRWRRLSLGRREGLELAVGVGLHIGRKSAPPPARLPPAFTGSPELAIDRTSDTAPPSSPATRAHPESLVDSIIATASDAMGRPYEFGGTGEGGEGFDCSGLIQYAYARHGIKLPRRSVEQAGEGSKVERDLKLLVPADILTFSNRGGRVTHVGLYLGGGRFIHSATRGVQISMLHPSDPYGRWWYKRWVGVRRIVNTD